MPNKDLVIEFTKNIDSFPKGAQVGVAKESDAVKTYGDGTFKIVGYQDGSVYEPPASPPPPPAAENQGA